MSTPNSPETSNPEVVVQISYCPELGIYHYIRNDGDEFFFDTEKLEKSLETFLSQQNRADAEYMSRLTAGARQFPHKLITYYADGKCKILDPPPPVDSELSPPEGA